MATRAVSRRSVVKLAYGAPVVAASMRLRSVGAQEAVSPGPGCADGTPGTSAFVLALDTLRPVYPATIFSYSLADSEQVETHTTPSGYIKGCVHHDDFSHIVGMSDGRECYCEIRLECQVKLNYHGTFAYLVPCS